MGNRSLLRRAIHRLITILGDKHFMVNLLREGASDVVIALQELEAMIAAITQSVVRRRVAGTIHKVTVLFTAAWCVTGAASMGAQSPPLPDVSRIAAANPVLYTTTSTAKGKATFLRLCQECHDEDGKALAQAMGPAADLTDPTRWKFGTGDAHLFRSIRDGAGSAMPAYGSQLKEEEIWDIVNFIRSIGPSALQSKQNR